MSTCCILGLRHEWSTNQLGGGGCLCPHSLLRKMDRSPIWDQCDPTCWEQ
jgi:hypothetical protein